jgi:hypothetical protein
VLREIQPCLGTLRGLQKTNKKGIASGNPLAVCLDNPKKGLPAGNPSAIDLDDPKKEIALSNPQPLIRRFTYTTSYRKFNTYFRGNKDLHPTKCDRAFPRGTGSPFS